MCSANPLSAPAAEDRTVEASANAAYDNLVHGEAGEMGKLDIQNKDPTEKGGESSSRNSPPLDRFARACRLTYDSDPTPEPP